MYIRIHSLVFSRHASICLGLFVRFKILQAEMKHSLVRQKLAGCFFCAEALSASEGMRAGAGAPNNRRNMSHTSKSHVRSPSHLFVASSFKHRSCI
jgi:hypothetical protein